MAKKRVYLDHNATTPLHPEVKKAIRKGMEIFGNPSSLHGFGRRARGLIEEARQRVASFIGARQDEIIFVGSGSEANNTILNIFACPSNQCTHRRRNGNEIITTKIEHPCVLETSRCLKDRDVGVLYLEVDRYGKINIQQEEEGT